MSRRARVGLVEQAPARPPSGNGADARRADLGSATVAMADAWALRSQDALRGEGRRVAGGWPGTLTEARAVAHAYFTSGAGAPLSPLSRDELEHVARAANARARAAWRAVAASEEADG